MNTSAAIEKAAKLLRAAGDDEAADELLAEQIEDDSSPTVEVNVIDVPVEDGDGGAAPDSGIEGAAAVAEIEAAGDATVQVIEAQTAAQLELADAEHERELERIEAAAAAVEPVVVIAQPDPEPRTSNWFYRDRRRKSS